jgi:MFS family permease
MTAREADTNSRQVDGIDRVLSAGYRRMTIGIVAVIFLIAFEAMAVATAMPVAARELNGLPLYAWAFSAFLTTSVFTMVLSGEWSDRAGPAAPLIVGVGAFTLGLLVSGTAVSMPVLILGRAVQGLGLGLVIVAIYVVVARLYPEQMRPRVFSAMSSAWVLPSLIGPAIAGFLADSLSWRLVFLLVPPLVLPALWLVVPGLRRLPAGGEGAGMPRRGRKRLALAAAVGAALLQYAGTHLVWASLLAATAGIALLAPSVPRLLPAGALRLRRGLPTIVIMRGVMAAAFFGAETFIPLMLIEQRGLSTTLAGLTLTGGALGWAFGSWYQGRPRNRWSRPRLVQVGTAFITAGIAAVTLVLLPGVPVVLAAAAWTFGGVGMGLGMASLSVLLLEQSPVADQGANSAALQLCDALGSILAIGAAGAIFAAGSRGGAASGGTFAIIWVVMVAIGVVGVLAAPRVRSARSGRLPASPAPTAAD